MKKLLILTYEEDPHAKSVCNYLEKREIEYFIVNTDKLIGNYEITFHSESLIYSISDKSKKINLDEGWNIWNRRVMDPELPEGFPKDLEDIIFTETERTWEGMLFSHNGTVINKPQSNFAANNKIDQLRFVQNYGKGIIVPETILTNNPEVLQEFYDKYQQICHKLQKAALVQRDNEYLTTYNNLVSDNNMKHSDLIRRNPNLFQRYIDKKYEIRITALKDEVVGIAIHSQDSDQSKIDFRRYDFENVPYKKVELPQNIIHFCRDLLEHYNLSFGEIDMIYTPNEEYVFLELNPNGQWLWLELKSGYNLTKDIAENLIL